MMNQPKIKAYWKSAAMLLVAFGVQALLFLLLLYMYVLDKGNPSVLEISGSVLIFASHALPAMLLCTLVAKRLCLRRSVVGTLLFALLSAAGVVLTIAASEGILMLIYQRSTTLDWQMYTGVGIMGTIAGAIASLLLPRSYESKSLNIVD